MNDTLSFSLGLTQLDHCEPTNRVIGSVLREFDNEDPNFIENRSKYHNDLIKMKKPMKDIGRSSKNQIEKS